MGAGGTLGWAACHTAAVAAAAHATVARQACLCTHTPRACCLPACPPTRSACLPARPRALPACLLVRLQDIYTLFHLHRDFKFISKTSNFLIPIIGWSMFLTGGWVGRAGWVGAVLCWWVARPWGAWRKCRCCCFCCWVAGVQQALAACPSCCTLYLQHESFPLLANTPLILPI